MTETIELDDIVGALTTIRREIHAEPELGFKEHRTAGLIASFLEDRGLEVHRGIGGTGVVGVLRMGTSQRSVGLRADMDALGIQERTGLPYASRNSGVFHGCGHDGHIVMLLGAAAHLAKRRDLDGTVHFIFQPAEEGLGGAKAMIDEGLFERFPCDRVFALHNWPGLPAGVAGCRPGPIMAAADKFEIVLSGRGGHAALPHTTPDVLVAASQLVLQLNTLVSRVIPPTATAVLSVTQMSGGHAHNVIPAEVRIGGTVRTFDVTVQDLIESGLRRAVEGVTTMSGTTASIVYDRYYPATINDSDAAKDALSAARTITSTQLLKEPAFTSEDFSFMLQQRPGAYIWLGQGVGDGAPSLHAPTYDFNDDIIETGVRLHVALAAQTLGAGR